MNGGESIAFAFARISERNARTIGDIRRFFIFFLFGNVGWIFFLSFGAHSGGTWVEYVVASFKIFGTAGLLSGSSLIIGALLGFLFGIPRSLASAQAAIAQDASIAGNSDMTHALSVQPNTNLEQISDWLTKVLVGVGLTQINKLVSVTQQIGTALEPAFTPLVHAGVIALSIIGAFGFGGFVWAYFESRTSLMNIFSNYNGSGNSKTPGAAKIAGTGPDTDSGGGTA